MNIFNRALRATIKNKSRSVFLLVIIFIISNLLVIGVSCKTVNVATQNKTKQSVGASFRLEINERDRFNRLSELPGVQYPNGSWGTPIPDNQFESLLMDDIIKISQAEGIKNYNVTTRTTPANPVDFQRIESENRDQSSDFLGVNVYGNLDMVNDFNVMNGYIELVEGRFVQEYDEDAIVISEELALLNDLTLGDTLSFNSCRDAENSTIYSATIIGIFHINHDIPSTMNGDTFRSENTIFSDLRFPEKAEGHDGDPCYKYATFYVEDVDEYETTKENVKNTNIDWVRYDFIDNNGISEQMAVNFNNLYEISNLLLLVIILSSLLILSFIFGFWIRNRRHEIGVFMSLGSRKTEIVYQVLLEALFICIIGVILAGFTSPKISDSSVNYIVLQYDNEIKSSIDESKVIRSGTIVEGENEIAYTNVDVSILTIMYVGILTLILVFISVIITSAIVMARKPIQILSYMS